MPPELKPNFKRINAQPSTKRPSSSKTPSLVKRRVVSVEDTLKKLEEKEAGPLDPSKKENPDDEEETFEEDALEDDEMDAENDYGNSYFDNGEAFNEEDDNLDDGPVY